MLKFSEKCFKSATQEMTKLSECKEREKVDNSVTSHHRHCERMNLYQVVGDVAIQQHTCKTKCKNNFICTYKTFPLHSASSVTFTFVTTVSSLFHSSRVRCQLSNGARQKNYCLIILHGRKGAESSGVRKG